MEKPQKTAVLPLEFVQALANYLSTKPYNEVRLFMQAFENAKVVDEPKQEAPEPKTDLKKS